MLSAKIFSLRCHYFKLHANVGFFISFLVARQNFPEAAQRNISVYLMRKTPFQVHGKSLSISSALNHINLIVFYSLVPKDMTARLQQHEVDFVGERSFRNAEDKATVEAVFI